MQTMRLTLLCLTVLALSACGRSETPAGQHTLIAAADKPAVAEQAQGPLSYNRDIRPILSDKCFACHGPDRAARAFDLRLDVTEDGDDYFGAYSVIEPGDADASELVSRVYSTKPKIVMPPPAFKVDLTDEEKALLKRWVQEGAAYEPHWAFVPVAEKLETPAVKDEAWPRDALDRFVLARLESQGLKPAAEASRERWLRRVTYDLNGLPPTPEDIEAFVNDSTKDAYEKVVDRLLASPHYGEHMATQWIDLARYADSYGYQSDQLSPTWPWRDWVLKAFNENLPYDQFITYQVAGDLLPNPTRDQRLATAFNRLHRMTNEGGSISEEWLNEYTADRVHTFGTAFMGMTYECARCHDHRYDPILQDEYYELYAFFNSIDEYGMYMHQRDGFVPTPSMLLPDEGQQARLDALNRQIDEAEQRYESAAKSAASARDTPINPRAVLGYFPMQDRNGNDLPNAAEGGKPGKTHGGNTLVEGKAGQALRFAGDTHVTFENDGALEPHKPFTIALWLKMPKRYDSALLFHNSSGTDAGFNGSWCTIEDGKLRFVMARFWPGNALAVETTEQLPVDRWVHVTVTSRGDVSADGMAIYIDGQHKSEVLRNNLTKHHGHHGNKIIFDSRMRTITMPGAVIDEVWLLNEAVSSAGAKQLFDGQGVLDTAPPAEELDKPYREALAALTKARHDRLMFQTKLLEVSIMQELPEPTPAYTLARGAYDAPQNEDTRVERETPDAFPPMPEGAPRNRLGLAQWLTDPGHPLTSRVAVNRLWQQCFGDGIVATPDNFGLQGALPTHPELLDYLARSYMNSGWDTKAMLRRIVLTATYRQDSAAPAERWTDDPDNAWLARGSSRRLTAEQLRDTALAASGLLHEKMGGPPVAPYQPPKLWRESNSMSPAFKQSVGKDLYRRSIYTVWKRTAPMPNMAAFDAPGREVCSAKRSSTNTPLQALVLLNDVQFIEACRVLAERVIKAEQDDQARLMQVYQRLAAAQPDAEQSRMLLGLLDRQRAYYKANKAEAEKYAGQGESARDKSLDAAEVAAWTAVVQVVMNSDATVWRR